MKKLPENDPARLTHMREAAEKAIAFAKEKTREDFEADEVLQLALVRLIEIIGEAASQVTEGTRLEHPDIAWQDIVGMRNRVIHGYFDVSPEIIWNTLTLDIPDLLSKLPRDSSSQ